MITRYKTRAPSDSSDNMSSIDIIDGSLMILDNVLRDGDTDDVSS